MCAFEAVQAQAECDLKKRLKQTNTYIDELQREAFNRDRAYQEIVRSRVKILAQFKEWDNEQRELVRQNLLRRTIRMTAGERVMALANRASVLALAKKGDQRACKQLESLKETFRRLNNRNASTWQLMLRVLDNQILRERLRN